MSIQDERRMKVTVPLDDDPLSTMSFKRSCEHSLADERGRGSTNTVLRPRAANYIAARRAWEVGMCLRCQGWWERMAKKV